MRPNDPLTGQPSGPGLFLRYGKYCGGFMAFLLWLIILSISPAFPGPAERVPNPPPDVGASKDPVLHDSVSVGINLVLNDRFKEGLRLFEDLQQTYPDHPAPHFFKAATYQSWMSVFRLNRFQEEFEENIDLAIEKGRELLKRENNPWLFFM